MFESYRPLTRDKYLVGSEVKKLLEAAKDVEYYILFLAANTGVRPSELNQIKVQDINYDEGYIKVRTIKQKKGQIVMRDVIVNKEFLEVVKKYIRKEGYKPQSRLFEFSRQWLWEIFKKMANKAGLNPKYTLYSLRHYRAITLLEETKDLEYVRSQLGHSSISVTGQYLHTLPEKIEKYRKSVKTVT